MSWFAREGPGFSTMISTSLETSVLGKPGQLATKAGPRLKPSSPGSQGYWSHVHTMAAAGSQAS